MYPRFRYHKSVSISFFNTVEEIKKAGVKVLRNEKWQIEDDLLLKEENVYILRDNKLRLEIIWLHHNTLIAEHEEQWKMVELVTNWWPGVTKEVKRYVKEYDQYQRMKNKVEMLAGKLRSNDISREIMATYIGGFYYKVTGV